MRNDDSSAARTPEVRLLTMLKCDIVNSTRLARLDLEDQDTLTRSFYEVVDASTRKGAGFLIRTDGDGALIAFGHSEAPEDAAEAAVRTALSLVDGVGQIDAVAGVELKLRIGIASGKVALGGLIEQSARREVMVNGLVPVRAERLRAEAPPGGIVVDDLTRRHAGAFFAYLDLGWLSLKGFEDTPTRGWQVLGPTKVVSRFDARRRSAMPPPILGRQYEQGLLSQALFAALDGHGSAAALMGDAGIGKSRLARELVEQARSLGARVMQLDCAPSAIHTPLYPLRAWLRQMAGIEPGGADELRGERLTQWLVPLLGQSFAEAVRPALAVELELQPRADAADAGPGASQDESRAAVVAIVDALVRQSPLLLLFEDMHWADATTVQLVRDLAQGMPDRRCLLLLTSRDDAGIPADLPALRLLLPALDPSTSADLVRALASTGSLGKETVHAIVQRCEGVPLLLEELTRSAMEPAAHADLTASSPALGSQVPEVLQLVVQSRLGRYPALRLTVQAASVIGREFSLPLLGALAGDAPLDTVVGSLVDLGLFEPIDPLAPSRCRFRHAMIRDAVYQTLLRSDRRRLHRRIADLLRSDAAALLSVVHADELALHLAEAGDVLEAIELRLATAQTTRSRGGYNEAVGQCTAALALTDLIADVDTRRRLAFRLHIQHGVALTGKHGYSSSQAAAAYRTALTLCDDRDQAQSLYPIVRAATAGHVLRGELSQARTAAGQCAELAARTGSAAFRIDAYNLACYAALYCGEPLPRCRQLMHDCTALYRQESGIELDYPSPHDPCIATLALLPTVQWLLGDADGSETAIAEGHAHLRRLQARAQSRTAPEPADDKARAFDAAYLQGWIAGTRFTQRRYSLAAAAAQATLTLGIGHGLQEWQAVGGIMCLMTQAQLQPDAAVLAQLRATCDAFEAQGVRLNAPYYRWGLAQGYLSLGDREAARRTIDEALERAANTGETRINAELTLLLARTEPDPRGARRLLRESADLSRSMGDAVTQLRAALAAASVSAPPAAQDELAAALTTLDGGADGPSGDWIPRALERFGASL